MRKKLVVSLILIVVTIVMLANFALRTNPLREGLANNIASSMDITSKITNDQGTSSSIYVLPYKSGNAKLVEPFSIDKQHSETDFEFNISAANVLAVSDGVVVDNGFSTEGAGYYIVVKDDNANFITYKHLASEEDILRIGDKVSRGSVISTAGKTGNVAPPAEKAMLAIQINNGSINGDAIDFETLL